MHTEKPFNDITPFSLLDYPDELSCVIWFSGCNLRCKYCHNPHLVSFNNGRLSQNDVLSFLSQRKQLLTSVVLSGGEITQYDDLLSFIKQIKSLNFKIKIDTNGTNPAVLREIIPYIDYVALDIKGTADTINLICGTNKYIYDEIVQSLELLLHSNIQYEVRTTVHSHLLDLDNVCSIGDCLTASGYKRTWYIQKVTQHDKVVLTQLPSNIFNLNSFSELKTLFPALHIEFRNF